MLDEVNRLIIDYNGSNYLLLFDSEKINAIFNRIRYCIRLKSSISYVISQNYAKITIGSDDDLPWKKQRLHNVDIHIQSCKRLFNLHVIYAVLTLHK